MPYLSPIHNTAITITIISTTVTILLTTAHTTFDPGMCNPRETTGRKSAQP